jgi:hypothetical protein
MPGQEIQIQDASKVFQIYFVARGSVIESVQEKSSLRKMVGQRVSNIDAMNIKVPTIVHAQGEFACFQNFLHEIPA